jgi:hypothetical protein
MMSENIKNHLVKLSQEEYNKWNTAESEKFGAILTDLTSDSDAYLVDTLAWLLDHNNDNTMVSSLHYYFNQDIKLTDEFSYAEV